MVQKVSPQRVKLLIDLAGECEDGGFFVPNLVIGKWLGEQSGDARIQAQLQLGLAIRDLVDDGFVETHVSQPAGLVEYHITDAGRELLQG